MVVAGAYHTDASEIDSVLRPVLTGSQVWIKVDLTNVTGNVQIPLKMATRGSSRRIRNHDVLLDPALAPAK
jgi:hypothetical protein